MQERKNIDHTGKEVNPMGARLCESVPTISAFLRYENGEVIVEGETRSITDAASQIEGPGDAFDYELVIDVQLRQYAALAYCINSSLG